MTIQDKRRFAVAFNRLAVATRLPADQADATVQRIYFEGLETFPIEAIEDGAQRLAETADWFPKLAEWRDAADQAKTDRALRLALPPPTRDWRHECATCEDSGWDVLTCDGPEGARQCRRCAEGRGFYAHSYTVACACRETNRTWGRKIAEQHARAKDRAGAAERS